MTGGGYEKDRARLRTAETVRHDRSSLMDTDARRQLEEEIRDHCAAGRFSEATTAAIEGYGPEVFGYLTAAARDELDADEAFSVFCERVWRGLPAFRFDASVRTWAYRIARNALCDQARAPHHKRKVVTPSASPELARLAQEVRSATRPYLQTEAKAQIARLRESLDEDDRTLLILRVDRNLGWNAIAQVMFSEEDDLPDAELRKRAAALRKRFERIKGRLRRLADAESREGER